MVNFVVELKYTPVWEETKYNKESKTKKTWKRIDHYNLETGEMETYQDGEVLQYGKKRFLQLYPDVQFELHKKLSRQSILVLDMVLMTTSRASNVAVVKQKEIAAELNVSVRSVERSFAELKEADALRKKDAGQWMINPRFAIGCSTTVAQSLIARYDNLLGPGRKEGPEEDGGEKDDS